MLTPSWVRFIEITELFQNLAALRMQHRIKILGHWTNVWEVFYVSQARTNQGQ